MNAKNPIYSAIAISVILSCSHATQNALNKDEILNIISKSAKAKKIKRKISAIKKSNRDYTAKHGAHLPVGMNTKPMSARPMPIGSQRLQNGAIVTKGIYIPKFATEQDVRVARVKALEAKQKKEKAKKASRNDVAKTKNIVQGQKGSSTLKPIKYAALPRLDVSSIQKSIEERFEKKKHGKKQRSRVVIPSQESGIIETTITPLSAYY